MVDSRREGEAGSGDTERNDLGPPPDRLLDDPLAFIDADHARQRAVCRVLHQLADAETIERDIAHAVAAAMTKGLELHHRDEDADLFPLLLKRAMPEDGLAPILVQLGEDHVAVAATAKKLAATLSTSAVASRLEIDRRTAHLARRFATRELRHLAIETAIVMVIARKRLRAADLQLISRSMKTRRGLAV